MLRLAEQHVLSLEPYIPGRAIDQTLPIARWAKLGSNENCLGPSPKAMYAAKTALASANLYPNAKRFLVINKICEHLEPFQIKPEQVALGNGASELIVNLVRGVLGTNEAILFGWPSFVMYRLAATAQGRKNIAVPLNENMNYDIEAIIKQAKRRVINSAKLIFLANPNNPTGQYIAKNEMDRIVSEIPKDVVLVIDEAYLDYVQNEDYPNGLIYALSRPRTLVLRTFSKVYGLAGLRLGYVVGDSDVINILCRIRDPFNVNSVAQDAAIAALDDREHVAKSVQHNAQYRPILAKALNEFGFTVLNGVGNFLLAKRDPSMPTVPELCKGLMLKGIIIRPLANYELNDFVRISVGTKDEIIQLLTGLNQVLK